MPPALPLRDRSPDVVVVGAGVMGAWTAVELRRTGRDVLLLDAYGFGHPRATSGDDTRILRSSHGDDGFYARWSREARAIWGAFGREHGVELFVQAGALWFARTADGFEAASEATLRTLDIPVEHLSTDEVTHRWPGIRVDDLTWALFEPEGGLLLARRGVETVARAARQAGADVRIAAVRPPEPTSTAHLGALTTLDGSRIAAGAFVFACGPWLPQLFPDVVGDRIRVTKQNVHYLGPAAGDARWMAPHFPSWVDYATTFYGIGAVAGSGVKVATDSYGPPFDPSAPDRFVDPEALPPVREYCRVRFPDLADAPVVETRVCQYETTEDAHFVIDRHPSLDDVWLVGGGSGHGYKHGPLIGRYVTRLLDGHQPTDEERRFSWTRDRSTPSHLRTSAQLV